MFLIQKVRGGGVGRDRSERPTKWVCKIAYSTRLELPLTDGRSGVVYSAQAIEGNVSIAATDGRIGGGDDRSVTRERIP
jgi:hypothetical protein